MINEYKDVITNYSIIGIVIAILTALIRPFVSIMQTLRECLVVFIFSVLGGLILENWSDVVAEPVRYGLSGLIGFFAVKFYSVMCAIFKRLEQHPEIITDKIERLDNDRDNIR